MTIDTLVIAGASGAGKSHLVNEVRETFSGCDCINIVKRYTTRKSRDIEILDGENIFVTEDVFAKMNSNGEFRYAWYKTLLDISVWYGFKDYSRDCLNILPANEQFLTSEHHNLINEQSSIVVLIEADNSTRKERLERRDNGINQDEINNRMQRASAIEYRIIPDIIINNNKVNEQAASQALIYLVRGVLGRNKGE